MSDEKEKVVVVVGDGLMRYSGGETRVYDRDNCDPRLG